MQNLSKTLAIMGLLAPVGASALGIGDIRLHSALNQSLNAEIPLVLSGSDALDEIKVSLASPEAFQKAGVERHYYLTKLQFSALRKSDGSYAIQVSSRDVLREPFLNFLVEVNWPQGRALREFTVLLDPPATMPEHAYAETSAPAIERPFGNYERVAEIRRSDETRPVVRRSTPKSAVAPARPMAPPPEDQFTGAEYGPVRRDETLWGIVKRLDRDPAFTQEQMLMALYRANPQAFSAGNINRLKSGVVLRIPKREFIAQLDPQQARAEFALQQGWSTGRLAESGAATAGDQTPQAQLKLLAPSDAKSKGERAVPGSEAAGGKAKGDLALEVAETVKQENEEFRSRLTQLEQKLAEMQRLLALKNEQIAAMQAQQQAASQLAQSPKSELTSGQIPKPPTEIESTAEPQPAPTQGPSSAQPQLQQPVQPPATQPEMTVQPSVTKPEATKPVESVGPATPSQAVVPKPPPKAVQPKPVSPVKDEPGLLEELLEESAYVGATGGAIVLLGLVAWLIKRRRNAMIAETESILLASERESLQRVQFNASKSIGAPLEPRIPTKSSFLSEFTQSDFDALATESDEVDPISEADVYLAYGRYKQAEELIRHAIAQHPDRDECKLKLLEIYHATENRKAFENYVKDLKSQGKDRQADFWEKVKEMGRELLPDNPLFETRTHQRQSQSQSFDSSRTLDSLDMSDDLIEDLKKFEIEFIEPAFNGKDEVIPLASDNGVDAEISMLAPTNTPKQEDQYAPLEFNLGSLSLDKEKASAESTRGKPAELNNLIPFDLGKSESRSQAGAARQSANKSIDEILSEFTDNIGKEKTTVESERVQAPWELGTSALDSRLDSLTPDHSDEERSESEMASDSDGVENLLADLTDMDQFETKLDLAKAYADMEDEEAARDILEEVLVKGNEKQKVEARAILDKMHRNISPTLSVAELRSSRL